MFIHLSLHLTLYELGKLYVVNFYVPEILLAGKSYATNFLIRININMRALYIFTEHLCPALFLRFSWKMYTFDVAPEPGT